MKMKRVYTLLILLSLISGSLISKDIKVASWNVENLFDMQRDSTEYEEYIPGRHNWTERMMRKKLEHIADVICDLDADLIALQEVENENILRKLQKLLAKTGCTYRYRAIAKDSGRAVHVALLSKLKIAYSREIYPKRYGQQRAILEVGLDTSKSLTLFINHWKSQKGPESGRVVYAKALRKRLESLPIKSEYIALGDFNSDVIEYRRMDAKHNDTGGISGINQILRTTIGRHTLRCDDLERCPQKEFCLCNLWMELPAKDRWSHNFFGKKRALDAILIPKTLLDGRKWEYIRGSFGVFRPDYLFGRHGEIKRWEYRNGRHRGRGYSDHLPIYALFHLEEPSFYERIGSIFSKEETKRQKSDTSQKREKRVESIEELIDSFEKSSLTFPVLLEDLSVIYSNGRTAVLQKSPGKRAILLYGCAYGLKISGRYDIEIFDMKNYKGTPEITDMEIVRTKGRVRKEDFIEKFDPSMLKKSNISKVVSDIEGRYRNGYILSGGKRIRVYFKKRKQRPKNGSRIKIMRAQIGYYNGRYELVVWSSKDFIVER
jgi:endonuclease/exonuclease/phosphatase family metal-dependent hydrolase